MCVCARVCVCACGAARIHWKCSLSPSHLPAFNPHRVRQRVNKPKLERSGFNHLVLLDMKQRPEHIQLRHRHRHGWKRTGGREGGVQNNARNVCCLMWEQVINSFARRRFLFGPHTYKGAHTEWKKMLENLTGRMEAFQTLPLFCNTLAHSPLLCTVQILS